jgi:hypothetical protein
MDVQAVELLSPRAGKMMVSPSKEIQRAFPTTVYLV